MGYGLYNNTYGLYDGQYAWYGESGAPVSYVDALGGEITYSDEYRIHTFTTLNTQVFQVLSGGDVSVFILAGGGSGGVAAISQQRGGGGGGAGGYILCTSTLSVGNYNIIVGAGAPRPPASLGQAGKDGSTSSAFGMVATGGGGGASSNATTGRNGGCGGGGACGGNGGTGSQGYNGGNSTNGFQNGGGGGGGIGGIGQNGLPSNQSAVGGIGLDIWGTIYGVGGRGGQNAPNVDASANLGGGGNGGGNAWGTRGGSGIVKIKYKFNPSQVFITDGLISYYRFDETSGTTASDAYGSNHLTTTNGKQNSSGKRNYCYYPQSINQDAYAGNSSVFDFTNNTPFSIIGYFKTPTGLNPIICAKETDGGLGYEIGYIPSSQQLYLWLGSNTTIAKTTNYTPNSLWRFFCFTYSGNGNISGVNIYIDGVKLTLNTTGGVVSDFSNNATFTVGDYKHGGGYPLNGYIDELAIFNKELTESEITYLYNYQLFY